MSPSNSSSSLDRLSQAKLVVVTGKGGVGKTTISAALARLFSASGRRTLLLEADPRESLHQVLGTEPSGGELMAAGRNLWLQNLRVQDAVDAMVREKIPISFMANRVLDSPVYQHFVEGAPGIKEAAFLGYAYRMVSGKTKPKPDVVVVDAPATGHGLTLLTAPGLFAQVIEGSQLGELIAELAAFVADPAQCAVVVVTLAEEMPVQETLELVTLLQEKLNRAPELIVANALYPPFSAKARGDAELLALWQGRRAVNEREMTRLLEGWRGPLAELPLLPMDRSPALLSALLRHLEEAAL
jgi:hypothetical protein